ncbi:transketolase [bacterium]|nr:transketolase [Candidatus Parcubacteria bacterium]NCT55772.1 transketolase [bacterium]
MQTAQLEKYANQIRQTIIISLLHAGSGHPAGALGFADLFAYLYFSDFLKVNPKNPKMEERDRLYLSCGHYAPGLYSALALKGFFSIKDLSGLRDVNGIDGHPILGQLPGIENSAGPLGQGISQAIGSALAHQDTNIKTVCIISDGELQEGQTWEALMFMGNSRLKNLTVILDRNDIQISGNTNEVMPLEPLKEKFDSFNLITQTINGNDFKEIDEALTKTNLFDRPNVVIAETVAGKGISFMENDYLWHGRAPNKEEALEAINELKNPQ